MRSRHDLIETFSSFIQFEADRFRTWHSDPRLKRNMLRRCEGQVSAQAEDDTLKPLRFWVLYWHKQWLTKPQGLAQAHLLSYLQEACYWVAYKAGTSFTSTQYGVADCFQLAIAHLDKVLKGFNAEQGFDLKSYASAAFSSLIRDRLRQRQEVDICTDWSLLRKVSQKRLVAALTEQGLGPEEIERNLLVWRAYRLIYVPTQSGSTRRLSAPDDKTWQAITQQANAERASLSQPDASLSSSPFSRSQVETLIAAAAKAVRSYLYPGAVSMNAMMAGQDASEYIDSLTDADQTSPIKEIIAEEDFTQRTAQQQQLSDVLKGAIAQLDDPSQRLLTLYYQDGATQQAIATELGLKQYAISRALTRLKKSLAKTLAQWGQETLHITPSPTVLKHTSAALEEWLVTYYRPFEGASDSFSEAQLEPHR
ncbi:MAG: sigma-70 family RNA polymerase sigma factor [Cyanobacteria bacterium P01_A01_bin.116]